MATNETAASTQEYIEYLGNPDDPQSQGVTFLQSHTIPKTDPLWKRSRLGSDQVKTVTWERDPNGPHIGFKGARFLLPIEDFTPEQAAVLEKTPGYRRVTE